MNYNKIYQQIIQKAKEDQEERIRLHSVNKKKNYFEGHHIIPKSLNGSGKSGSWCKKDISKRHPNIVGLTAREHYMCHRLLIRMYPGNKDLIHAFWGMTVQRKNSTNRYVPSNRAYEEARILHANEVGELFKIINKGKEPWNKGKKGVQIAWNKGKILIGEDLEIRQLQLKNPIRCNKISNSLKGKKKSIEHVQNLRGKKRQLVICPNCNKEGGVNNMYRYHFDNCKLSSTFNK